MQLDASLAAPLLLVPSHADALPALPQPHWPANPTAVACYDKVWELALANLKPRRAALPGPASRTRVVGLPFPFADTAFSDCLFLWDSVFILAFARYGRRAYSGWQGTLDNFYASALADGFISKELRATGHFQYHPHDPCSTGPNVLAWCEWDHYRATGDVERLGEVFWPIVAYHRWMRTNRTWQSGAYWSNGLASGMDNIPRADRHITVAEDPFARGRAPWGHSRGQHREGSGGGASAEARNGGAGDDDEAAGGAAMGGLAQRGGAAGRDGTGRLGAGIAAPGGAGAAVSLHCPWLSHGHLAWVDATGQALLSAECLLAMARELAIKRPELGIHARAVEDLSSEAARLLQWLQEVSWCSDTGLFHDVDASGEVTPVRHVGAFWPLLAGAATTRAGAGATGVPGPPPAIPAPTPRVSAAASLASTAAAAATVASVVMRAEAGDSSRPSSMDGPPRGVAAAGGDTPDIMPGAASIQSRIGQRAEEEPGTPEPVSLLRGTSVESASSVDTGTALLRDAEIAAVSSALASAASGESPGSASERLLWASIGARSRFGAGEGMTATASSLAAAAGAERVPLSLSGNGGGEAVLDGRGGSSGAWGTQEDDLPSARAMAEQLHDPSCFGTAVAVPALARDDPCFDESGGYWRGGVWSPATYMVLRGLRRAGLAADEHAVALRHCQAVWDCFEHTGTVHENYSPVERIPGRPAKGDFVGWSGLGPVAMLFESVFGITCDWPSRTVVWVVRLRDEHGVKALPLGTSEHVSLRCEARGSPTAAPRLLVRSSVAFTLIVRWPAGDAPSGGEMSAVRLISPGETIVNCAAR